ncbi:PstS family phosphate ABC transporter substrate-binding protein [Dysgonomonas sp. HGC4]|uniref:PstS family phosphate ABC transporter substrate-binding protein n=1 Tax=Dysgonomonas sp. HGC4 TaxID=1658009 RepID=UPI00068042EB|nr:substrate-binding domain-containing protein [Dysgonomonas sp. HGC4]MBD8346446.1 substrate-binding domain-containing protein [Dysgonomonas sp. HGC4]
MNPNAGRHLVALLLMIILLFIGFVSWFIIALTTSSALLGISTLVFFILLIIGVILWSLKRVKIKYLLFALLGISLSYAAIFVGYEVHRSYIANIPTINDGEVDLREYQPFREGTKVVLLNEESLLTLTTQDSLPRIDGATALYPLYSAFVRATYPQKEYNLYNSEVNGGTTPEAFRRLIEGEVDIIFCAAPSKKQIEEAKEMGKTFNLTPIGREAFVFFVNKENPVRDITCDQIRQIYSGKITNWRDVGGKNEAIKAFQRPEGSGSQSMLERIMGDTPLMKPLQNDRVGGMGGIIDRTAQYKNFSNAIGYTFLFFATGMVKNEQIALLKVDGVYPDRNTIANNTYPFVGDFYAITTDTKNENVERFIEWILSPQGQYLVEKTGYTPINKE